VNRAASLKQEITQDELPTSRSGWLLDEREAVKGIETKDTSDSEEKGPGMEVHHLDGKVLMSPSPSQGQRELAGGEKISAQAANDWGHRGEGGGNHAIGCEISRSLAGRG
jgi:hypothetical protein